MSASAFFASTSSAQDRLEQDIKDTFYNAIADYVLSQDELSEENLPVKLQEAIAHTILTILSASDSFAGGIRLPTGRNITSANCPEKYSSFFTTLMELKSRHGLTEEQFMPLTGEILKLESFQELNPTQFIRQALGWAASTPYYEQDGVTADLIRTTFYNEMVTQTREAIHKGWLSIEDLQNQECHIYCALPALTIAASIQSSQGCMGLRLLDNKILNKDNCPAEANLNELVDPVLAIQANITAFSEEQFHEVKHRLAKNINLSDTPTIAETTLDTHELRESFAIINLTAESISQRHVFHQMVMNVIARVLEIDDPTPTPSPSM